MLSGNQGNDGIIAAIITAATGMLAVILGFVFKNRKQGMKHMQESWEELIEENASFREEIRQDLQKVKEERDALIDKVHSLEMKLADVIKENLEFRKRELELIVEIKNLKSENKELHKAVQSIAVDQRK